MCCKTDFLIRVWVPRQYAGQPYTRPRADKPGALRRYPRTAFPGGSFFPTAREPNRGERTVLVHPSALRGRYDRNGPGEHAMTTHNNHTTETTTCHTVSPVWDRILNAARSTPRRMPAGGWFTEVATNENWRTTTIVQRHRDRAVMTSPS